MVFGIERSACSRCHSGASDGRHSAGLPPNGVWLSLMTVTAWRHQLAIAASVTGRTHTSKQLDSKSLSISPRLVATSSFIHQFRTFEAKSPYVQAQGAPIEHLVLTVHPGTSSFHDFPPMLRYWRHTSKRSYMSLSMRRWQCLHPSWNAEEFNFG